jgi:hypothetical protein
MRINAYSFENTMQINFCKDASSRQKWSGTFFEFLLLMILMISQHRAGKHKGNDKVLNIKEPMYRERESEKGEGGI